MKNRNIFLGVALAMCFLMMVGTASAQFTEVWKVSAGTWPIFSTGDNFRGAALNRATGHYLVAQRAPKIYVYNAATGVLLDSLNVTGISGGGGSILQDIEVTSDGVVYASNLVLIGLTENFKIYRWADDNSATVPTVAFSGPVKESARVGDAFDVAGTGTGTVIYAGGNNSATDSVQVFTTSDGTTFTNSGTIKITANDAGAGIAQVTAGGDFLTSRLSANSPIRLYNGAGGGRLESVPTTVTPALQADITYLEAAGRKWVASAESAATAGKAKGILLNASYGLAGAVKVGITPALGASANSASNGADVELQYNAADSTMTIYVMIDNNGFGAYKTGNLLTINLAPFAGNIIRTQFVPLSSQNDTVFTDVQDDQYVPKDSVRLKYNVDGGTDNVVLMTRTSGDSIKGTYRGILPGSANGDGKRIQYYITVTDNLNSTFTSAKTGYFAGLTKMTLAGSRAVDTNGVNLWVGYAIRAQGICTQEDSLIAVLTNRSDIVIQDEFGGMDFTEFAQSSVPPPWRTFRGHVYQIVGPISQFSGHIQVAYPSGVLTHLAVTDLGPGTSPAPKLVTVRDLAWDRQGELLENSLVRIQHARLTASSLAWPAAGAAGTNITITDNGVDSLTLRVPALSSANGNTPRQPFTVVGVASQFDASTPFKDGYQVIMRQVDDVAGEINVAFKDTTKNFLGTDVVLPATVGNVNGLGITAFQFTVQFDSTLFKFKTVGNIGSISGGYAFSSNVVNAGLVNVAASGVQALKDSGALFTIVLTPWRGGAGTVALTGQFNEGSPAAATSGGFVIVTVPKLVVNVATPKFKTAVTNVGHIGALNAYQDTTGFVLNGADRLYEGSMIFATDQFHVSNAARFKASPSWNPGLRPAALIAVEKIGSVTRTSTIYDDGNQTTPIGIKIFQTTVTDTAVGKDGYMMLLFKVLNQSASALSALRVGSLFDFDITPSTGNDRGEIVKDSSNTIVGVNSGLPFKIHVAYERQDPAANFIGVVPLSQTVFKGGRIAVGTNEIYSGKITDSAKYVYISSFRATNTYGDGGAASDMSIFSSVGPYAVPVNDTARAAFALVVGNNLGELIANARQAQKDYVAQGGVIQILTGVKEIPNAGIPVTYGLDQNYPNPFNPSTTINFALPKSDIVSLKVYDVLGREVRTLVNERLNAGYQQVAWDGRNAFGAQVASGMYIYRITAGEFTSSKKMMMLK
jgi:hypothetical protein